MSPLEAWTRYGMWILLFFLVPYCAYCHLVYMMGKRETNNSTSASCQRLTAEGILWLMLTTLIFYMQFLVPAVLCGIKLKMILFLSLAACNFVLHNFHGLGALVVKIICIHIETLTDGSTIRFSLYLTCSTSGLY